MAYSLEANSRLEPIALRLEAIACGGRHSEAASIPYEDWRTPAREYGSGVRIGVHSIAPQVIGPHLTSQKLEERTHV